MIQDTLWRTLQTGSSSSFRIFPDKAAMLEGALETATIVASKSPIAVQGTKVNLVYARDHTVDESLDYMVVWDQGMLQSEDVMKSGMAMMEKKEAVYSKL